MSDIKTKNEYQITIYHDTRRATKDGKYPVKLRVYTSQPKKTKLFATKFKFTETEFNNIWAIRPRGENKTIKRELTSVLTHAEQVAARLTPFTIGAFEKRLFIKVSDLTRVEYLYSQQIEELTANKQLNTASTYDLAQKAIVGYCKYSKKKYSTLTLFDIDQKWLEKFERYMIDHLSRSATTLSIYIRTLRTIFNMAIESKDLPKHYYPFGKKKYKVPASKKAKKALNNEQLKRLFQAQPQTIQQQKAKDFWFFSYACNGMNIKDICLLKNKDFDDDKFYFYRAKTIMTSKENQRQITVHLNDFTARIIAEYGEFSENQKDYVFPILSTSDTPTEQRKKIKAFTRFINQHIKRLAVANDLPEEISTYWARHSFATQGIKKGASMEYMQESLGHSSTNTTQQYFSGFDDETKKEFSELIMEF